MKDQIINILNQEIQSKGYATTAEITHKLIEHGFKITPLQVSKIITKEIKAIAKKNVIPCEWVHIPEKIEQGFVNYISVLDHGKEVTIKQIKEHLRRVEQVDEQEIKTSFDKFFVKSGFEWTGAYNRENHKVYRLRRHNTHFSKSTGDFVQIDDMHPNHIYNTIITKYPNTLIKDCFTRSSEVFQLLKAYFIFDIKQTLKSLFK